jgi:hypothetical protein
LENILLKMAWKVVFHQQFATELESFPRIVSLEVLAAVELLERFGPELKRPHCDTLKGSRHANLKELRFSSSDGVWRIAFAFDPKRCAIMLVGGDKSGVSSDKFYRNLIRQAEERLDQHLAELSKGD